MALFKFIDKNDGTETRCFVTSDPKILKFVAAGQFIAPNSEIGTGENKMMVNSISIEVLSNKAIQVTQDDIVGKSYPVCSEIKVYVTPEYPSKFQWWGTEFWKEPERYRTDDIL